jgi:predicted peroxiredoxin
VKSLGKLAILLFTTPEHTEHGRFAFEVAKAAVAKGHQVTLFGLADGVFHAATFLEHGKHPDLKPLNQELEDYCAGTRDPQMGESPLKVAVCSRSSEERNLEQENLLPGAVISSTSKFGALVRESDRTIFLIP